MESGAAGDEHAAAPELWRFSVPARSAPRAERGAGEAGGTDAGDIADVQAAGGNPACRPWRGCRGEEASAQQEEPRGRTNRRKP